MAGISGQRLIRPYPTRQLFGRRRLSHDRNCLASSSSSTISTAPADNMNIAEGSDSKVVCDICAGRFRRKGFGNHRAACLRKLEATQRDAAFGSSNPEVTEGINNVYFCED